MSIDDATEVAIGVMSALASQRQALEKFLQDTGLTPDMVRQAAGSPGFLPSVLDYVASDEGLLICIAATMGEHPARISEARAVLSRT
jgi:hypothetical protein